jgi:transcription termination factor NusB
MSKDRKGQKPSLTWPPSLDQWQARTKRKRLNASEKRALKAAAVQLFAQRYARKAQKGVEPNDRRFDTEIEETIKNMKPEELDRLLRDGEDQK